jgi:hypothetical protein
LQGDLPGHDLPLRLRACAVRARTRQWPAWVLCRAKREGKQQQRLLAVSHPNCATRLTLGLFEIHARAPTNLAVRSPGHCVCARARRSSERITAAVCHATCERGCALLNHTFHSLTYLALCFALSHTTTCLKKKTATDGGVCGQIACDAIDRPRSAIRCYSGRTQSEMTSTRRRGVAASVLLGIAAGCIVAPAMADLPAYRPPRRSRRAADDPRFAGAKAVADASNGRVVFCRMNLVVEVRLPLLTHSRTATILVFQCAACTASRDSLAHPRVRPQPRCELQSSAGRGTQLKVPPPPPPPPTRTHTNPADDTSGGNG